MEALRIKVEAPVTSFRHPHFLIGRQPTFDVPPPSTIYGHVASALGEWPDPASFRFAYHFDFDARAADLEHQHVISAGGSKFTVDGEVHKINVQGNVQPHTREFLFNPVLTLYLDRPEWKGAFEAPVFPVILGRSQDLAAYTEVETVRLEESNTAYLENTLLPFTFRQFLAVGVTQLMPRFISPPPDRQPHFDRFIALRERVLCGIGGGARHFQDPKPRTWLVDPETRGQQGARRGLVFHSFVDAAR